MQRQAKRKSKLEIQDDSVNLGSFQISDGVRTSEDTDRFDTLVKSYFQSKSREADPKSFDMIIEDVLESEKLAQTILSAPAMTARQVLTKLSVLDSELLNDLDCEAPVDRRHILAFASLKIDIVRFLAQLDA